MMFLKGHNHSEKKNQQDNLPALGYFFLNFNIMFFSNFPSKKSRSNVTYPLKGRVNETIVQNIQLMQNEKK
jgi:hypothetical protein